MFTVTEYSTFTDLSGARHSVSDTSWNSWLRAVEGPSFSLDGQGGIALLTMREAGLDETAVVLAPPECRGEAVVPSRVRGFSSAIAHMKNTNTALLGLCVEFPSVAGDQLLFMSMDAGRPANRDCLTAFAKQTSIHVIVVHPRSGVPKVNFHVPCPQILADFRRGLAGTAGVRSMDDTELCRMRGAVAERFLGIV